MDKIYQVFVSSTFDDLKDERSQVSNSLAKAGYIAAGMELFPASDQQQLEYIQRIINRSDYYVVVIGARYGSLADNGLSYTENEFEYARSQGIPVLAFLPAAPEKIPFGKVETDADKREKLEFFKVKLKTGRIVEHWNNVDDLCLKVVTAVAHAMNLTPRPGWIRGDQAIDPKVLQDLERLRIENDELKARLSTLQRDASFDPSLVGPEDLVTISFEVAPAPQSKQKFKSTKHKIDLRLGRIFTAVFEEMRIDPREPTIAADIASLAARIAKVTVPDGQYVLDQRSTTMLRRQLEALGLIEVSITKVGILEMPINNWIATQKGRSYAALKLAQQKSNVDRN